MNYDSLVLARKLLVIALDIDEDIHNDVSLMLCAKTRIERLERELATLREQVRWRKYPDEKPTTDDYYLVMIEDAPGVKIMDTRYYWCNSELEWQGIYISIVTHWRPQPEPPKEEQP